ncbi:hypothetical protein BJX70DRAFT_282656 [Aspergillus crustosus]
MPSLLTIPPEILHRVFFYADQESRKALRLSSVLLGETGRSWIFQTTTISRVKSICARFENILDRPDIVNAVTKIYLDTIDPDDGNGSVTTEDGDEFLEASEEDEDDDSALPPRFWKLVNRLSEFPRLQSVVIRFDPKCEEEDDWGDAQQTKEFRAAVLKKAFSVIAALPRLPKELGIQDLQNINPTDEETVGDINKVLGGLQRLRLNNANELDEGNGENNVEKQAIHDFYPSLASTWLLPALTNLEHLSIYSSIYWGFNPIADLETAHFPRLKSLALGNYTFVRDAQLEWILSLGETLEELYLDDCPILFEVAIYPDTKPRTSLDPNSYKDHPKFQRKTHAYYNTRWADYLRAFNERLPHLKHFRLGHNPHWWEDDTTPFEKEDQIRIKFYESYMVYCDGFGPSQYMERLIYDSTEGYDDGEKLKPSEEDEAALKELLTKLGQTVDEDDDYYY